MRLDSDKKATRTQNEYQKFNTQNSHTISVTCRHGSWLFHWYIHTLWLIRYVITTTLHKMVLNWEEYTLHIDRRVVHRHMKQLICRSLSLQLHNCELSWNIVLVGTTSDPKFHRTRPITEKCHYNSKLEQFSNNIAELLNCLDLCLSVFQATHGLYSVDYR